DYLYLHRYRSALAATAARARRAEDAELLASMAAEISSVEMRFHEEVLADAGISAEDAEPSPTTVAYSSYLSSLACTGSFEEALAALLPCSWIYLEVGRTLAARSPPSPNPVYRRWIEQYSGREYSDEVLRLIGAVDSLEADGRTLAAMRAAYRMSAIYEYMFWDEAYRDGRFPYSVRPP
ncbi:MAG: thiaminase II, partial [Conexivisphaera sp.]